jgi:hypothetical protein
MTDEELDRVLSELRRGQSFSIYGADGEWGIAPLGAGRFRVWTHDPGANVPDREVGEAEVREDLRPFDLATVLARLR